VKEAAWKEETFKYNVTEWATTKEKVKVAETKAVTKEVEVVSYSHVPVVTNQRQTVHEWICVPTTVTYAVAPAPAPCGGSGRGGLFGGLCGKKKHNDCAPPCGSPCEAPCPQLVTRTVMQRQMVTREVEMDVTAIQRIEEEKNKTETTHESV